MADVCPTCSGFGYLPFGHKGDWYASDWRLMLDPTVEWVRCPDCSAAGGLARLQEDLARHLWQKLNGEVDSWETVGAWEHGHWQGQDIWRWEGISLIAPGPASGDAWMLVSDVGVMTDLTRDACTYHCERAGAPALPFVGRGP